MGTKRNYLCDSCDGWGSEENDGEFDRDCFACFGSGVIAVTRAEGDAQSLQPWGSSTGRTACRETLPRHDALTHLSPWRARFAQQRRAWPSTDIRFTEYGFMLAGVMRPVRLPGARA